MKRFFGSTKRATCWGKEHGESSVEWVGLTAAITILFIAVMGYINVAGGGTIGQAVSDLMAQMVLSFEGGASAGAPAVGAPGAPGASPPAAAIPVAAVPQVAVPSIAVPSVGVAQMVAQQVGDVGDGQPADEGGGFWAWLGEQWQNVQDGWTAFTGWVGEQWQSFTGWMSEVGQSIAAWFDSLPGWLQGLIMGLAAAVTLVVAVVAGIAGLAALGVTVTVSGTVIAIALAIGAVVAMVTGLIYGLTHSEDSFNPLAAYLWSLGAGALAFALSVVAAVTGAASAAWAWLTQTAWPALVALVRGIGTQIARGWAWLRQVAWPAIVQGVRTSLNWLRQVAWPTVVQSVRTSLNWLRQVAWPVIINGVRGVANGVWNTFASRFPWLAGVLSSGLARLGWLNALRWGLLGGIMQGIIFYKIEVPLGWTEFSWTGLATAFVQGAVLGALLKIFGVGVTLLPNQNILTRVIGSLLGKIPDWRARGIAIAVSTQLFLRTGMAWIRSNLGDWLGRLSSWVSSWWTFSQLAPPIGPLPEPVPTPVTPTLPPSTPTPSGNSVSAPSTNTPLPVPLPPPHTVPPVTPAPSTTPIPSA